MKVNEIERLLTRYYDGETSETEEKELKRFFTEEDIPAHLLAEKEIFMQLAAQPAPEIPEGLESRLSRKIDQWDTGERRTLKIKKHTRTLRLQWIGSIAASLLILLSVGLYLYKPSNCCSRRLRSGRISRPASDEGSPCFCGTIFVTVSSAVA